MTVYNYQREDVKPLKPYEMDWPHGYCTRSGNPARLIANDLKQNGYPLAWAIGQFDSELVMSRLDGRVSELGDRPGDIMCAMPPPVRLWIVLDDEGAYRAAFPTEDKAITWRKGVPNPLYRVVEMKEVR
ncbi:hypothetical protein [Komagataeibacter oboediens]|uniref:hypothetical protein n=1 Tax=Komagataeibacter oboediens TaxID=65958 RepID=UPI000237E3E0|nr:hypothetical protein [Komagataeibacter oboediens]